MRCNGSFWTVLRHWEAIWRYQQWLNVGLEISRRNCQRVGSAVKRLEAFSYPPSHSLNTAKIQSARVRLRNFFVFFFPPRFYFCLILNKDIFFWWEKITLENNTPHFSLLWTTLWFENSCEAIVGVVSPTIGIFLHWLTLWQFSLAFIFFFLELRTPHKLCEHLRRLFCHQEQSGACQFTTVNLLFLFFFFDDIQMTSWHSDCCREQLPSAMVEISPSIQPSPAPQFPVHWTETACFFPSFLN